MPKHAVLQLEDLLAKHLESCNQELSNGSRCNSPRPEQESEMWQQRQCHQKFEKKFYVLIDEIDSLLQNFSVAKCRAITAKLKLIHDFINTMQQLPSNAGDEKIHSYQQVLAQCPQCCDLVTNLYRLCYDDLLQLARLTPPNRKAYTNSRTKHHLLHSLQPDNIDYELSTVADLSYGVSCCVSQDLLSNDSDSNISSLNKLRTGNLLEVLKVSASRDIAPHEPGPKRMVFARIDGGYYNSKAFAEDIAFKLHTLAIELRNQDNCYSLQLRFYKLDSDARILSLGFVYNKKAFYLIDASSGLYRIESSAIDYLSKFIIDFLIDHNICSLYSGCDITNFPELEQNFALNLEIAKRRQQNCMFMPPTQSGLLYKFYDKLLEDSVKIYTAVQDYYTGALNSIKYRL